MSELSRRTFLAASAAASAAAAAGLLGGAWPAQAAARRRLAVQAPDQVTGLPFGIFTYPGPSPDGTSADDWTGTQYTWQENVSRYGTAMNQTWTSVTTYSEQDNATDVSYCAYQFLYQGSSNGGITSVGAPWGGTALIPFQGFPMWTTSGDITFSTIAAGDNDAVFQKILNDYSGAGFTTVHLRPAYEWNLGSTTQVGQPSIGGDPGAYVSSGDYDPQSGTGGTPSPFVLAWQHLVTVMRAQAAANGQTVYFHWNPAIQGYNGIDLRLAYPGNSYVDYIALDVYDQMWPLDWNGDANSNPTSLPYNWPGYSSQPLPSSVTIPWTGYPGAANTDPLANESVAAWANNIDNLYHYLDFPEASQYSEISQNGSLLLGTALGSAQAWGVLDHIVWASQCGKPISFPEVGDIIDLAGTGQPGGLDNTGQWIWARDSSGSGGGIAPLNANGSNFPGYLASRIAWANSIGVSCGLVCPFVAAYGYNQQTFDWLGWAPAVGTSWADAFSGSQVVNGASYTLTGVQSGKCLDADNSQGGADGSNVQIWSATGGANQQWQMNQNSDGSYTVVNVEFGRVLEVEGQGTADGSNVDIWDNNGGANQHWLLSSNSNGSFTLTGVQSGLCLEVNGQLTSDGANVDVWSNDGGPNEQWFLTQVS